MKQSTRQMTRLILVVLASIVGWITNTSKAKKGEGSKGEQTQEGFTLHKNCTLIESKYNDGDSFLVSHEGKTQEYRLYYVDTPESRDKPYDDHRRRVTKQGEVLGGLSYEQTIKVGKKAKTFTKTLLKKPFKVYTKGELVYQGPRLYAFVKVQYKGAERWLHELLVENGLARIHTKGVTTPEGVDYYQHKKALQKVESQAKRSKEGAWR